MIVNKKHFFATQKPIILIFNTIIYSKNVKVKINSEL